MSSVEISIFSIFLVALVIEFPKRAADGLLLDTNLITEMEAWEKTNLPLTLAAQLIDGKLGLGLAFNQQKYSADTVATIGTHLKILFDLIVQSPVGTSVDEVIQVSEERTKVIQKTALRRVEPATLPAETTQEEPEVDEEIYFPPTNDTEEVLAKIWCNLYVLINRSFRNLFQNIFFCLRVLLGSAWKK